MAKNNTEKVTAKAARVTVTYKGINNTIDYLGYTMPQGKPVEVDEKTARMLIGNAFFEIAGVQPEAEKFNSTEDALEAEREKHRKEIAELTAQHGRSMEEAAESLKADWENQRNQMQAEIDGLKAQLSGERA